ncbi:MAG: hypothetical protein JWQ63_3315 [Mucilaginibacter sp.]|nr:hypothetical protein [Mucilaginibacter sp.]
MGRRQNNLKKIVHSICEEEKQLKPSSSEILTSKYSNHIFEAYSFFEGKLNVPPTGFGPWDISTNKFIIELDEERHFNRYRFSTLESPFYKKYEYFSLTDYKAYCKEKEKNCLKAAQFGGNWKNNSTEKHFCKSNLNGVLDDNGSSRWKQRAYYDFLKDITSKILKVPLIRISVYDTYKGITIDQLLETNTESLLLEFVNERIK